MDQVWLDELSEFLRIPSVSADPMHEAHVREAGEWVRDFVRRAGGEAELRDTDSQPLVVGEIRASAGNGDAPTILVYGHFDVQPPAPLELWDSEPFEPTVRDEWLYARGVADDERLRVGVAELCLSTRADNEVAHPLPRFAHLRRLHRVGADARDAQKLRELVEPGLVHDAGV